MSLLVIPSSVPSLAQPVERHRTGRAAWLRAAVLGADDAIVSTASLMLGVAAAEATRSSILVAGAMSMAVGEYVSVSSQRDAELADIARETAELEATPESELDEITAIYVKRGLDAPLAQQVAQALSAHDRLGAHMRDELGLDPNALARPFQAAWISALSFAAFAAVPIAALLVAPANLRAPAIAAL
jgi:VIT1/CCC1 family predicted Fe2+/Mn2+ transporter